MNKTRFALNTMAFGIILLLGSSIAQAQATRTWVSGVGDDVNPCSRTAPCKTFAGAISKTATGGEISVLDPGGFGALTITKSITVNGDGTLAGVLSSLTTGFIVNNSASNVVIRSVSINGATNGVDGIRVLAAANVLIENVSITGITGSGIFVNAGGNVNVAVKDVTVAYSGTVNLQDGGIRVTTSSGIARVSITDSLFIKNRAAVSVGDRAEVVVRNSVAIGDKTLASQQGYFINATTASTLTLENCTASHFANGVRAQEGAGGNVNVFLSNNMFAHNDVGVSVGAGPTVTSFINNRFAGNGNDSTLNPIPTTAQK